MVVARSCRYGSDDLAGARELHRREQAGKHGVDVSAGHRKFGRSEAIHRMTKRVHLVAVDMGDRARAAEHQVAPDQHHADSVARFQRPFVRLFATRRSGNCGAASRHEALVAERSAEEVSNFRFEARHHERRRNGAHQCPNLAGAEIIDGRKRLAANIRRPIGKRVIPVQRLAKCRRQVFARQRILDSNAGRCRPRVGQRRRVGHFANRCNAGNWLFRETAERVRHRADQFAVDVDGAAAHAGDHAGMRERPAFELGENQISPRPDHVLQDADDVRPEFFDMGAIEHRVSDADHAGPDVVDAHHRCGGRQPSARPGEQRRSGQDCTKRHNKPSMKHLSHFDMDRPGLLS